MTHDVVLYFLQLLVSIWQKHTTSEGLEGALQSLSLSSFGCKIFSKHRVKPSRTMSLAYAQIKYAPALLSYSLKYESNKTIVCISLSIWDSRTWCAIEKISSALDDAANLIQMLARCSWSRRASWCTAASLALERYWWRAKRAEDESIDTIYRPKEWTIYWSIS